MMKLNQVQFKNPYYEHDYGISFCFDDDKFSVVFALNNGLDIGEVVRRIHGVATVIETRAKEYEKSKTNVLN